MSNRRCPKCGEEYSDTYRSCPFCEEEEAIKRGHPPRRSGRRVEKRQNARSGGAGGVMLLLTGVVILGVLGYVFFGDNVADAVGIRDTQEAPASDQDKIPPVQPDDSTQDPTPQDPEGSEPAPGVEPGTEPGTEPDGEGGAPEQTGSPADSADPLALSQTDITIPAGETGRLTATGGNGTIIWSSSNPEIASVEGGSVTGKAGGTVTITATSGEETATCKVKVEGEAWVDPNASSYRLSKDDFTLSSSETTWQMKMKRSSDGGWEIVGPDEGVTWASDNTGVATISETGLITRVGRGKATISATVGGTTLTCIVRLK